MSVVLVLHLFDVCVESLMYGVIDVHVCMCHCLDRHDDVVALFCLLILRKCRIIMCICKRPKALLMHTSLVRISKKDYAHVHWGWMWLACLVSHTKQRVQVRCLFEQSCFNYSAP